ncbi:tumor necrosis factor ligand superfamily member 13 [Candoia aspera]|uniref:tumor necrosis factor ligand superfamily member 13 n=1 Tax=Candoia aspera TaxID=51853 RepID=UPI002FD83D98
MPPKIWRGTLSPLAGLAPLAHLGLRQRPLTPWAAVGALAVGLLACLVMLLSIQGRLEVLREELAGLRREALCEAAGTAEDQGAPDPQQEPQPPWPGGHTLIGLRLACPGKGIQCQVIFRISAREAGQFYARIAQSGAGREDVWGHFQLNPSISNFVCSPVGKQSVLHLVPTRHSNNEEDGGTEIWWAPFLRQGRSLEPSGQDVMVKHTGLYFIYSQVLFHDPTFTMGQVLRRVAPGRPDQILFRCVQSMPRKLEKAYNSCYSGGVFYLQQGDRLSLRIPRFNASFDISAHGTFLGVFRL